jgi:hypothetical protein
MIIDHRGFCMPKLQVISTSENVPGDGSVSSSCRVTIGAQQSDAKAVARSAETNCITIGEILRAFTPTECANYFRNSVYAQS